MSKKYINGLDAFRKLDNVDNRYLSEADAFISLTGDETVPVGKKTPLRERFAFTQSGWFAAAVSAVVALGAVILIVRAGGSAPSTVARPANTFTPAASVSEGEAEGEDETVLTAEVPEEETVDEAKALMEARRAELMAVKQKALEEWRLNHPSVDEEETDDGYSYVTPMTHEDSDEEMDKAAAIAAYLDTLGLTYDYITYNEHDQVCTMLPCVTGPQTMYDSFIRTLQAFRLYDTIFYDEAHGVMAHMFWVFTPYEDGSIYMNRLGYDDNFVLKPLGEPGNWTAEEIDGIVADVFADKLAEGWNVSFAQMEDKQWLNVCFEVDENTAVDSDGLSLLMNEVWRRMDKKVGMVSVSFCRPGAGTDEILADFYIDYKTCHYGAESTVDLIPVWETPTIPYEE